MDPKTLCNVPPEKLDELMGMMAKLEEMEAQKIKLMRDLRKAITLLTMWPNLWADHSKNKVSHHWRDLSENRFKKRNLIFVITVRDVDGATIEAREFQEADVPEVFERPEAKR